MTSPRTRSSQEIFWEGEFGNEYIDRNNDRQIIASNIAMFSKVFASTVPPKSVIELGANIGLNLIALQTLFPEIKCAGVEINKTAADILAKNGKIEVHCESLIDFASEPRELALIKGVLIHINPDLLPQVYKRLYDLSSRYIVICEYYNPSPVTISYRGHSDKLFKRDFAGEIMTAYPDLSLVDYGFVYRRDPSFPLDDLTWFLLEKKR